MFVHKFTDSVYERTVHFVVGPVGEYEAYLRSLGIKAKVAKERCGEMSSHLLPSQWYADLKTRHFFLWMIQFKDDVRDFGSLSHECFHVTQGVMEELGVPYYADDDNEPFAYYLDSLVRQFLTAWRAQPQAEAG